MEATFDGFSIREYTSKMRSVDVLKCWPFGGGGGNSDEVSREDVESWLPPMTVPKFRWWSDELEAQRSNQDDGGKFSEDQPSEKEEGSGSDEIESARSDKCAGAEEEKLEMVCPVCRDFNAATLTAVNAHMDGCLAQTMREERRQMRMMSMKSKSKAPKKRSIAEIFEVEERPQIETVLKFWPFSEDPDEVSITVTKFRWLSRRLEELRSNREGGEISANGKESAKSDEGDAAGEEEKLEMVCPVCRDFNAATVTAVNAHIDGCLALAMRDELWQTRRKSWKPKPKPLKKRSIAEILTMAPPVRTQKNEVVEVVGEGERSGSEEKSGHGGGESSEATASAVVSTIKRKSTCKKRNKKKVKVKKKSKARGSGDFVPLNNGSGKTKASKKKKMKKTKNLFNDEFTAKKDDAYKSMVQTSECSCRKLKGTVGNKTVALDDIDTSANEKKLGLKILSVDKKQKVENCDSVGKQQKAVSPIRGILKNHLKHISGRTSSGGNIEDGTEESDCDVQVPTSDRHVKFSGKDDILDPKRINSFDETMLDLSSDALVSSLGKEQSSESDEGTVNLGANRNDDNIAYNIDKRHEVCPTVESKQFSNNMEEVTVQNFLKPCVNQEKSKDLVDKSESLTNVAFCDNDNLHQVDRGETTTLDCSPYADVSRPVSALQAGQIPGTNTQACESGAFGSTGKFIDHLEDPTLQVATVNSNANPNTRTFLEPSSSCSASYNKANERPEFLLHTYGDNANNGQALGGRLLSQMFSSDTTDNSLPFPSWGKGTVTNNFMDQKFFGLPLNSHGELINFSSIGKVRMNQPETSNTLRASLNGLSVNDILYRRRQEYLSDSERHFVQKTLPKDRVNPFPHYPARLGVSELHGSERADIHRLNSDGSSSHYVQPLDSELNLTRNPFIEHNQRDEVPNHQGNGLISPKESSDLISGSSSQQTMRLMGKDVPIGRSNKEMQQFASGDVWADEESRRRHHSHGAASENSLLGRSSKQDWISGSPSQISTQNVLQPVKIQSSLVMKSPDSEFPDLQNNSVSQIGGLGVSRNASSYLLPITPTSCAVFDRSPDELPEQFMSGAKPQGISRSQVLTTRCNFSQPTSLSNGELIDRKTHHHVTNSAFEFPFLNPAVEEHDKTSWFQRSNGSLPPWLLSSAHERLPGTSSQKFSAVSSKSSPQNMWGNIFTTPSVNHSAEVLYPSNPLTSQCSRKTPLCPASIVQPPHVPVTPVTKPPSTITSGCRNAIMVTDREKLDAMTTKDPHPCTSSRKRPAANLDDPTKPIKLPNIEVQGNSTRMIGLTRENSSTEWQRNTSAVELDPRVDFARSRCCQNETQNLNPRSYLGVDSFKQDGVVMSGPVKLSRGAKHILKPSQSTDQDNSRPIHSTIPIAATTDCCRDLEIQRKLTKLYRF